MMLAAEKPFDVIQRLSTTVSSIEKRADDLSGVNLHAPPICRDDQLMNYLVYVSQAERPMTRQELADLLEQSRRYNHKDGLTGLLIYKYSADDDRAYFMQLLEGDKTLLDATFERIASDRRHHTKVILEEGKIAARSFPDWSMGFRDVDNIDLKRFDGFADLGSSAFWERAHSGVLSDGLELMQSFYKG